MGLISLTWVFCHNLVKTHFVVIEILPFSCFVISLVKADGDHLVVPNCKKSKRINAKIIVIKSWYNSIKRFFRFYTLLFFVRDAIFKVYSYLILKQPIASIILTRNWAKSTRLLRKYCYFHVLRYYKYLQMAAILECQIAKNQNDFIQETFWHKVGSILTNGS